MDKRIFTLALGLFAAPLAFGQAGIFDPIEEPTENQEQARQPTRQEANNLPTLKLRGTSRFGDVYKITLVDTQNEAKPIQVEWRPDSAQQIEGFEGYRVVDVSSREARISLPDGQPCVASTANGVNCARNSNIMLLSLTTAEPLEPPAPIAAPAVEGIVSGASQEAEVADGAEGPYLRDESGNLVLNPFSGEPQVIPQISEEERQARAQRQAIRAARLQQFQPVRIPDEEVPPGMRKVSTPFGDRLVPEGSPEN